MGNVIVAKFVSNLGRNAKTSDSAGEVVFFLWCFTALQCKDEILVDLVIYIPIAQQTCWGLFLREKPSHLYPQSYSNWSMQMQRRFSFME